VRARRSAQVTARLRTSACRTNGAPPGVQAWCLGSWCVPQNFLCPQRDQPMLMPLDMRDWLPEDDLVFVVPARWRPWIWASSGGGTGPMVTAGRRPARR
jgi:hypothetical protein